MHNSDSGLLIRWFFYFLCLIIGLLLLMCGCNIFKTYGPARKTRQRPIKNKEENSNHDEIQNEGGLDQIQRLKSFEVLMPNSNTKNSHKTIDHTDGNNENVPRKRSRIHSSSKKENGQRISKNLISNKEIDSNSVNLPTLLKIDGNKCLNSILQGIASCSKYVEDMSNIRETHKVGLEKLSIFNELICILNNKPTTRLQISNNRIFKKWNNLCNQDGFEVIEHIINEIYREIRIFKEDEGNNAIKFSNEWLRIPLPMKLVLQNRIQCTCESPEQVFLQSDLAIHLTIPQNTNREMDLQVLFNRYFEENVIEEYECTNNNCYRKKALCYKKLAQPLPHTICVHLQRFFWNGTYMEKIKDPIKISKHLLVKSKFCLQKNLFRTDEKNLLYQNLYRNQMVIDKNENFDLISVLVHNGPVNEGEYICCKRINEKWFLIKDDKIKEIKEIDVLASNAHIMFFEKP